MLSVRLISIFTLLCMGQCYHGVALNLAICVFLRYVHYIYIYICVCDRLYENVHSSHLVVIRETPV